MNSRHTLLEQYHIIAHSGSLSIKPGDYSLLIGSLLIGGMLKHDMTKSFGSRQFAISARVVSNQFETDMERLLVTDPDVYVPGYAARHVEQYADLLNYLKSPANASQAQLDSSNAVSKIPMVMNLANVTFEKGEEVTDSVIEFGTRARYNLENALKGKRNQHEVHHAEYWAVWNATKGK